MGQQIFMATHALVQAVIKLTKVILANPKMLHTNVKCL
jgi:hypothetical protein